MTDPIQAFLQANAITAPVYPPNSRYYGTATAIIESGPQGAVVYLKRRFIAQPERFALLQEHSVVEGDRVDALANSYLGDSEQFWRLCDANLCLHPRELTDEAGRRLRITLPEGYPSNG